jgi:hyaluronoglucosaminidase
MRTRHTIILVAATALTASAATTAAQSTRLFGSGADFTSSDPARTTLGVRGVEAALGTLKVSHEPSAPGATDASAAAISIQDDGLGTRAQGIFYDAPGSTQAKILNLRLQGREVLTLVPDPTRPGKVILRLDGRIEQAP